MANKFITFEGCEGSGKSTQLRLLKEYLLQSGEACVFAREPGGTQIGENLRNIILDKNNVSLSDSCEALLYASARAQLIDEVILPSLKQDKIVVLDRYIDSSFAYQAFARGLGFDFIKNVNSYAIEKCIPALTVFLDINPESAFLRKGGADQSDRIELAGLQFHNRVYQGYCNLVKMFPDRIMAIDATASEQEIHSKIVDEMKKRNVI